MKCPTLPKPAKDGALDKPKADSAAHIVSGHRREMIYCLS